MAVQNIRGKLGPSNAVDTGDSPQKFAGENPRIDNKFDYDIAVVGLGPVGVRILHKHCIPKVRMLGFDVSESRLAELFNGSMSLSLLENKRIAHALDEQLLTLTADPAALARAAVVIICVPIPILETKVPDYSPLHEACGLVVNAAVSDQLIVQTTTTYAGATRELIVEPLRGLSLVPGVDVHVVFSPEPTHTDISQPKDTHAPRLVGGYTTSCREAAVKFFGHGVFTFQRTYGLESAEMTKLFETAYHTVNTALINEFAQVCTALDVPFEEVLELANLNPDAVSDSFAGSGAGGYALTRDPTHLLNQSQAVDLQFPVLEAALKSNKHRPAAVVERCARVLADLGKALSGSKVMVIGLSNQPDTADLAGSVALQVMDLLLKSGADVGFHDHHFAEPITLGEVQISGYLNPRDFGADLIFLHTQHTYADLSWIRHVDTVIDGTYRARGVANRVPL
ncbi:nucleotide sugar dehydrogenase [Glutamicibacter sp.]|uniref:nucleotide sugar dehydrogenase n=1 Tax=Glutamicibacter sp. TaxID=1931995 RepID=UPI002B489083|nr:nucleotide sugar dehydrogenase [Glutamicibacter sp.]HJX78340.1 nucleotide sugar dehydrogenase [Glutamicibacter sp.]